MFKVLASTHSTTTRTDHGTYDQAVSMFNALKASPKIKVAVIIDRGRNRTVKRYRA